MNRSDDVSKRFRISEHAIFRQSGYISLFFLLIFYARGGAALGCAIDGAVEKSINLSSLAEHWIAYVVMRTKITASRYYRRATVRSILLPSFLMHIDNCCHVCALRVYAGPAGPVCALTETCRLAGCSGPVGWRGALVESRARTVSLLPLRAAFISGAARR